jgi:hypothetical protein
VLFDSKRPGRTVAPGAAPAGGLAAGVSCKGGPHRLRQWCEVTRRVLAYRNGDETKVLEPVPGKAAVLAFDAHREKVLLDNGETWNHDGARWLPGESTMKENDVKPKDDGPALIAAGTLCGPGFWLVGADRSVWTWGPTGRAALADESVPEGGRILAVDVAARIVLLEGGERFQSVGGRWCRIGRVPEATGAIKVRALASFCLSPGRNVPEGEELDLPEAEARRLTAMRLVGPTP